MKQTPGIKRNKSAGNIILDGILVALLFWVVDALVDTLIFEEGGFTRNIIAPGSTDVWMRLVVMGLIIGMSVYVKRLVDAREKTGADLKLFRDLINQSNDAIFVIDPETSRLLDVNDKACTNLGYDRDELLKLGVLDIEAVIPDGFSWEEHVKEVQKEGYLVLEGEHKRKDGTTFPVEINVRSIPHGERDYMVAVGRDVTVRKRVEKALMTAMVKAEEEKARSEAIIAGIADGISIQDTDFKILYQNQILKDIFGDHVGEYCYRAYAQKDSVCEDCPVAMCFRDGKVHKAEKGKSSPDGKKMQHFELTASPIRDVSRELIGSIEIVRDITERKQWEQELRESEEKYRNLAENLTEVVYRAEPETFKATYVNSAIESIYGYTVEEWLADPDLWEKTIHPDDKERISGLITEAQGKLKNIDLEYRIIRKDESIRWVEDRATWHKDEQGKVVSINGMVYDITERKTREDKFKELAGTDTLTGAFNRAKFNEIIKMEIERAKRFSHSLCIILLDLDRFKAVNDRYGHIVGDDVLKGSANLVKEHIRSVDYLVRWGGEEFMIISPETGLKSARMISERIRKTMENYSFDTVGAITGSFGIAEFKRDDDVDSFIKRADMALYEAKAKGRNRVEIGV